MNDSETNIQIHGEEDILLSVVIPCYERPEDLRRCLKSLSTRKQMFSPPHEIIVTDDSKSNDCRKLVEKEFPAVKWGTGKRKGPGANRNAGAARATGKWLVFIDDDCVAQEGYLQAYLDAILKNPEVQLFEGYIFPDRPKRTWAETCPENSEGGMFWTSNLCVRKKVFDELGGFDETFEVAYEDVDFAYRIQQDGKKTLFVPNAAACHPWRTLKREGNNWKPKGFEWKELELFIKKHPEAHEHSSPKIYAKHFLRMLTKDLYHCVTKFRCRGLSILSGQVFVTFCVILRLLKIKILA
jgi:GT2 family glycosyltransferase